MGPSIVETSIRHTRHLSGRTINCGGHWLLEQAGQELRARCSLCGERREFLGRSITYAEHQLAAEQRQRKLA